MDETWTDPYRTVHIVSSLDPTASELMGDKDIGYTWVLAQDLYYRDIYKAVSYPINVTMIYQSTIGYYIH